jgi:formylmethanofuran dehydrogenase subunit E
LFHRLEKKLADGTATDAERLMQKQLKALDLLHTPFDSLFTAAETSPEIPPYAPLARSVACAGCGEMTMETKTTVGQDGNRYCLPCTESG